MYASDCSKPSASWQSTENLPLVIRLNSTVWWTLHGCLMAGGRRMVPVTNLGGQTVRGFSESSVDITGAGAA